jgi:hypothetical protein
MGVGIGHAVPARRCGCPARCATGSHQGGAPIAISLVMGAVGYRDDMEGVPIMIAVVERLGHEDV